MERTKLDRRISYVLIGIIVLAAGVVIGFSIRPAPAPVATPTAAPTVTSLPTGNVDAVRTEAVATFGADLTSTAAVVPTGTFPGTQESTPEAQTTGGPSPTPTCLNLRFVRDVSIPDNTPMTPAQVFTKSWLVENNGTCEWDAGFQVILIGGIAMGGSPFQLTQVVGPAGRIQVSIKMVAPTNQTGIVQGTWKMADATGKTFGDYMSVVIVVGSGTGGAPTLVPPATTTGTAKP